MHLKIKRPALAPTRAKIQQMWASLTRRQRQALTLLALANLLVLGVLVLFLARTPSYEPGPATSPLAPARLEAGQSGADPLHAMSRVALADVLLWSLAEIDDAELARRLDYEPPRSRDECARAPATRRTLWEKRQTRQASGAFVQTG